MSSRWCLAVAVMDDLGDCRGKLPGPPPHPLAVAVLAFVVAKPIDFSMECTSICPRSRHSANIDSRRQLALEELETESCQRRLHTSWRRFRRKGGGFRSIVTLQSSGTRPLQVLDKRRHLLDALRCEGGRRHLATACRRCCVRRRYRRLRSY